MNFAPLHLHREITCRRGPDQRNGWEVGVKMQYVDNCYKFSTYRGPTSNSRPPCKSRRFIPEINPNGAGCGIDERMSRLWRRCGDRLRCDRAQALILRCRRLELARRKFPRRRLCGERRFARRRPRCAAAPLAYRSATRQKSTIWSIVGSGSCAHSTIRRGWQKRRQALRTSIAARSQSST